MNGRYTGIGPKSRIGRFLILWLTANKRMSLNWNLQKITAVEGKLKLPCVSYLIIHWDQLHVFDTWHTDFYQLMTVSEAKRLQHCKQLSCLQVTKVLRILLSHFQDTHSVQNFPDLPWQRSFHDFHHCGKPVKIALNLEIKKR